MVSATMQRKGVYPTLRHRTRVNVNVNGVRTRPFKRQRPSPGASALLSTLARRVVCGIHIRELPRSYSVQLDDGLTFRPGKMVHARRHGAEATNRQATTTFGVERVAHAQKECALNHGDVLDNRVEVRRDAIIRGHPETHSE